MELILLILKIVLIAFLVLLGLILLALGIILLVPVRYEISGSIGDSWEIRVKGKLTYLLSIVKVLFSYEEDQFDMKIFIFGSEKKMQKEDIEDISEEIEEAEITLHEKELSSAPAQDSSAMQENAVTDVEKISSESTSPEESMTESALSEENAQKRKQTKQKKEKKKNKIDFAFLKQQLTDEHNKSVIRKIWSEICYLLKHFKFRKIVTDLVFATGDPATTGQALGVLCMIPSLYRYNFKITPDFEADEAYIKGTFLAAGKVRLIHILVTILRLIFDKEVRLVVKRILTLLEK